jgi:hypothetical protein
MTIPTVMSRVTISGVTIQNGRQNPGFGGGYRQ